MNSPRAPLLARQYKACIGGLELKKLVRFLVVSEAGLSREDLLGMRDLVVVLSVRQNSTL